MTVCYQLLDQLMGSFGLGVKSIVSHRGADGAGGGGLQFGNGGIQLSNFTLLFDDFDLELLILLVQGNQLASRVII